VELDVSHARLLRPGDGETITDLPDRNLRILLAHELLDVTWTRHGPGQLGADPHIHREHVDSFFVLEGELVFGVGPEVEDVRAPAGTFVSVPQNVVHSFRNNSDRTSVFLNFHAPSGGFADYLRGRGGFDSFDPPADGGRPVSDLIVSLPGEGERLVRQDRVNLIKGELPEISAFDLSVEGTWDGVGAHEHADQVDTFFVLEGEAGFLLGEEVVHATAGSFFAAPPRTRHGIRNVLAQPIRFLNVHAPDSGFAGRLRAAGEARGPTT
jgi:mannose-6-phosphate isomerase-like protein (cupin superfamily)